MSQKCKLYVFTSPERLSSFGRASAGLLGYLFSKLIYIFHVWPTFLGSILILFNFQALIRSYLKHLWLIEFQTVSINEMTPQMRFAIIRIGSSPQSDRYSGGDDKINSYNHLFNDWVATMDEEHQSSILSHDWIWPNDNSQQSIEYC